MNLYLISQSVNNDYDTYSGAIVKAIDADTARCMSPYNGEEIKDWETVSHLWCNSPDDVDVMLIGIACEGAGAGLVLASFHAG